MRKKKKPADRKVGGSFCLRELARLADGTEAPVAMVSVGSSRWGDAPWGCQGRLGEQVSASRT